MTTIITPPTPQRLTGLRPVLRAAAYLSYAGGFTFVLSASVLMLASCALNGAAVRARDIGDGLREQALSFFALGNPVAAAAFRARRGFHVRRQQGVDVS